MSEHDWAALILAVLILYPLLNLAVLNLNTPKPTERGRSERAERAVRVKVEKR